MDAMHDRATVGEAGRPTGSRKGSVVPEYTPPRRVHHEMIGGREWKFDEVELHVNDQVRLWEHNPRIRPDIEGNGVRTEDEIGVALRNKGGYDPLRNSIRDDGQMTPIYAWKPTPEISKHFVIEGNTRVVCKRELLAKYPNDPRRFEYVRAKILPPEFTEEDIVLLLVGIHVRGSGVRDWDRFVQAQTVYRAVKPHGQKKPVTTITKLAAHMGKSVSWVSRLVAAYEFANAYADWLDDPADSQREAVRYFSVLEEIGRASKFGPKVRDLENAEYEQLRADVFGMVHRGVFKEYRDARFIQDFYDDPEKWEILKQGEAGIANKLAADVKAGTSNLGTRIKGLPDSIRKTLAAKPDALSEEHLQHLQDSVYALSSHLTGASALKFNLAAFRRALRKATIEDLEEISTGELDEVIAAVKRVQVLAGSMILSVADA